MARHLSVASVIDKNKITSSTPWVILLEIDIVDPNTRAIVDTLRIAGNDENIVFGTDAQGDPIVYQAANFVFDITQNKNEDPSITLTLQDQTRYIHSRMEAMAGGLYSNIKMLTVNTGRLDQPAELEQDLEIITSSVQGYVVTFQLGSENPLSLAFPRSRQWKDRCAWRYKGYGCRYAGALATCDYTLDGPNGCNAHANTLNFKGVPGLVSMNL